MDSAIGWLLDVTVEQNAARLWIKTIGGNIIMLTDKYLPSFYILPKNEIAGAELFHILSQQPIIRVEWQSKLTDIFDYDKHGIRRLLCVYLESTYYYKTFLNRLQKDARVVQLFNTELSHVQQYLFTQLKVEPTSKVQVQYDSADSRLITLTRLNESEVEPLPFSILCFEVSTSSPYSLDSHDVNDPISRITARYQEEPEVTFEDNEEKMLTDFCKYVLTNDPDILVSPKQHYRSAGVLHYLFAKISEYAIDVELGRDKTNKWDKRNSVEGRIYFDGDSFRGVVDVIEKCRFACLPLGLAASYSISRLIDSRNCYELINRGFVISRSSNRQESIRNVKRYSPKTKVV
jgi:DNA polymerase elongation subunit (family B)